MFANTKGADLKGLERSVGEYSEESQLVHPDRRGYVIFNLELLLFLIGQLENLIGLYHISLEGYHLKGPFAITIGRACFIIIEQLG